MKSTCFQSGFSIGSAAVAIFCLSIMALPLDLRADDGTARFFETHIRPLLVSECMRCHGEQKQTNQLRVDSRAALLKGGDAGPALLPGNVADSLILQAVRRQGDLQMPPEKPLNDHQIGLLEKWIRWGAPWPDSPLSGAADPGGTHWAFQAVRDPDVPVVTDSSRFHNPIDAYVLRKLAQTGLPFSPQADRRTLIRRVRYALTGLPPSARDVEQFVDNTRPDAYERLVDRWLGSPQYGEHWCRHWLDVARYSDTKGYVYGREERFWVHAWAYRDWVTRALNEDMPYDRFLLLQLAADQVANRGPNDMAAMGFLTLGRRFLGVTREIIDDRIDVVCRGTMGLTVGCARCHDHKYDPIATADYYSLYGVFDSCGERLVRACAPSDGNKEFEQGLRGREEKLQAQLAQCRVESSNRARERVGEYLRAQLELEKFPPEGFDQVFQKTDLLPSFVGLWEEHLRRARRDDDPVFIPWHAYRALSAETFTLDAADVAQNWNDSIVNPLVYSAFIELPESFDEVIQRYANLFAEINQRWQTAVSAAQDANSEPPPYLDDPAAEQLRRVLYGAGSPCEVPQEPIVTTERFFDTDTIVELWKLQAEVDRWIINTGSKIPFALALFDRPIPRQPRIFVRGNPMQKGDDVPRRMLPLVSGEPQVFQHGSGRLELARAIIDPANPLTSRVMVNRVWAHYFGRGLVTTPSDFGLRSGSPSHPELLDWLATRLVADAWSLKKIHRSILLSSTFRQASTGPLDDEARARAIAADPANRLLWRMNPRRLTFEEFRDSMLVAGNGLDRRVGGKPANLLAAPFSNRRSIYGLVDRQFLPATLRTFDFANPDLHIPQRNETSVPQQALFFMNHPLVLERAKVLADLRRQAETDEAGIQLMFRRAYQRPADDVELHEARRFVDRATHMGISPPSAIAADWQYGYGPLDESGQRVEAFHKLPHFTGDAWQGGAALPDPQLGWVRHTATGGHPGDAQHNSIRRWTAQRAMTVKIDSRLTHEPEGIDGIRAQVIGSQQGVLATAQILHGTAELVAGPIVVSEGETIDFVVSQLETINYDQYLWEMTISECDQPDDGVTWNSKADFTSAPSRQLGPWEQLAQLLLSTNEFLFVD